MSIINARINTQREQLACDLVDSHAERIVVCTPSKIVFEMKSAAAASQAETSLKQHGYSTELYDQRFLHARF